MTRNPLSSSGFPRAAGAVPGRAASSAAIFARLRRFPDDPGAVGAAAEWLRRGRKTRLAAKAYARAARLHGHAGNILQAIGSQLMAWRLAAPPPPSLREFYLQIRRSRARPHAVRDFFSALRYPGWLALLKVMRPVHVEAGSMIRKFGAPEDHLFFIVSGSARRTRFFPMKTGGAASGDAAALGPDQFFGDVFPFEREAASAASVQALTPLELIRIPKAGLAEACRRHPDVARGVARLFDAAGRGADDAPKPDRRRASRRPIEIHVTVETAAGAGQGTPLRMAGRSLNLGIGGLCLLVETGCPEDFPSAVLGREVTVTFRLPDRSVGMDIGGRVAWARPLEVKGAARSAMGIQFTRVSPQVSGYLMAFADLAAVSDGTP